jgi:hypothetical protein
MITSVITKVFRFLLSLFLLWRLRLKRVARLMATRDISAFARYPGGYASRRPKDKKVRLD